MASSPRSETLKPSANIKALPPTTVRQIGATQLLIDPSSAVKELIDNALDARATAIFVDISSNTLDAIQVKDNGHGIASEDRPLVCRRYCTSKIRAFEDLNGVCGKWLGFRGEAMASLATASGTMSVMTRVEGEPVAVLLKYDKTGELVFTERASHPVGTTVKLCDLFSALPVRKQATLKDVTRNLAKIKRIMQAYALARPAIRFQLRITKAKSAKGNFNYAPKTGSNVEDAAFKIVGRDCASQCEWIVYEADGFEIYAFLPKVGANATKISNQGTFISVDRRPIGASRGIAKRMVSLFRERLRKANAAFTSTREPFLCMNITCPPTSYDPNIEPAKDDVLFENEELVLGVVDNMFTFFYPETLVADSNHEPPSSANTGFGIVRPPTSSTMLFDDAKEDIEHHDTTESLYSSPQKVRAWRSSMYGMDEDLAMLSTETAVSEPEEQEEGGRSIEVSNPWTIAKMNTSLRSKSGANAQLMTPMKQRGDVTMDSSSPVPDMFRRIQVPVKPLTPRIESRTDILNTPATGRQTNLGRMLPPPPRTSSVNNTTSVNGDEEVAVLNVRECPRDTSSEVDFMPSSPSHRGIEYAQRRPIQDNSGTVLSPPNLSSTFTTDVNLPPSVPHQNPRQRSYANKPFVSPFRDHGSNPNKQPGKNGFIGPRSHQHGRRRRIHVQRPETIDLDGSPDSFIGPGLSSDKNTDIRTFFGHGNRNAISTRSQARPASLDSVMKQTDISNNLSPSLAPQISNAELTAHLRAYAERAVPPHIPHCGSAHSNKPTQPITSVNPDADFPLPPLPFQPPYPAPRLPKSHRAKSLPHESHIIITRSKSSKLPLNFIPAGQTTAHCVLQLRISIAAIRVLWRKLDISVGSDRISGNSPEWGRGIGGNDEVGDGAGVFGAAVEEDIRMWTERVSKLMRNKMEPDGVDEMGADVVDVVEEGIRSGLGDRGALGDRRGGVVYAI